MQFVSLRKPAQLGITILERRDTPAQFLVDTGIWDASLIGSLPWAVGMANNTPGLDIIEITRSVDTNWFLADGTLTILEAVEIKSGTPGDRPKIAGGGTDGKKSVLVFDLRPTRDPNDPPGEPPLVTVTSTGTVGGPAGPPAVARLIDLNFDACVTGQDPGRAITVAAGTVRIEDAKFTDNTAANASGGAIGVKAGAFLQIAGNVQFVENMAHDKSGGAIWTEGSVVISGTGNTFSENSAKYGGAIASGEEGIVMIYDASFTGNYAYRQGGAIWLNSTPTVGSHRISEATFKGNFIEADPLADETGRNGGAIYISAGQLSVSQTEFTENKARYYGGGLYAENATVTVASGWFLDNRAKPTGFGEDFGGAIFVGDCGIVNCTIYDKNDPGDFGTVFTNNSIYFLSGLSDFNWDKKVGDPSTNSDIVPYTP